MHDYYPKTTEAAKGHLNQQCKNSCFTKRPFEECNAVAALQRKKVKDILVKTYDHVRMIFSDQTGQFLMQAHSDNKYIMVLVEIDSNAIIVEPMKSHHKQKQN